MSSARSRRLLVIGGILNLVFALFHVIFPWMFAWGDDLEAITSSNRAILYTFHSVMVLVLLVFAYLSIVHKSDLPATSLGRDVLLAIGAVWLVRAMAEVVFFRIGVDGAVWRLALFLAVCLIYVVAWFEGTRAFSPAWPRPEEDER